MEESRAENEATRLFSPGFCVHLFAFLPVSTKAHHPHSSAPSIPQECSGLPTVAQPGGVAALL
eukprot:9372930-Prorocentrum_lima.AAC.1